MLILWKPSRCHAWVSRQLLIQSYRLCGLFDCQSKGAAQSISGFGSSPATNARNGGISGDLHVIVRCKLITFAANGTKVLCPRACRRAHTRLAFAGVAEIYKTPCCLRGWSRTSCSGRLITVIHISLLSLSTKPPCRGSVQVYSILPWWTACRGPVQACSSWPGQACMTRTSRAARWYVLVYLSFTLANRGDHVGAYVQG